MPELTAAAHAQLALMLLELGEVDEAGRHAEEARRHAEALAPTSALGQAHIAAGLLARAHGDPVAAAEELEAAVALHESGTPVLGIGGAYPTLAHLHADRGDSAAAFSAAGRGLALACDMSDARAIPLQLEAMAAAVAAEDRFEQAATLLGSAAGYRTSARVPAVAHEQHDLQGLADRLSEALGAETMQQIWDVGFLRTAERSEETLAQRSILLHLLPGAVLIAFIVLAAPVLGRFGLPPVFALFAGIGLVIVPIEPATSPSRRSGPDHGRLWASSPTAAASQPAGSSRSPPGSRCGSSSSPSCR